MVLGTVLAAFVLCILPQHRATAAAGIRQVSLGWEHSAALKTDGSLWLWGSNEYGELGNGSSGYGEHSNKPVKVMTGVQSVDLENYCSAAVKKDGSLWLWGLNGEYEQENGSEEFSSNNDRSAVREFGKRS